MNPSSHQPLPAPGDPKPTSSPTPNLVRFALTAILFIGLCAFALSWFARVAEGRSLTLYTSQDPVYADLILQRLESDTNLRVRRVYDSEAVKTVGLANRLLAEMPNPQCDLFWNNEMLRTRQLAARGAFDSWSEFGYRSRRLVINTNLLAPPDFPSSLLQLTNRFWHRKIALAYPLFGTTATHFLALRQHWGAEPWRSWCRALHANQPLLVDGNSVVVQRVGRGEAWIGFTDSDDVAVGQREGMPVAALPITELDLLIPNSVAIVRGAPNPAEAQLAFRYLQSDAVINRLIDAHALEGHSTAEVPLTTLQPDWDKLLEELQSGTEDLKVIFLR